MGVRVDFVVYVDDVPVADGSSGDWANLAEASHIAASELQNLSLDDIPDHTNRSE